MDIVKVHGPWFLLELSIACYDFIIPFLLTDEFEATLVALCVKCANFASNILPLQSNMDGIWMLGQCNNIVLLTSFGHLHPSKSALQNAFLTVDESMEISHDSALAYNDPSTLCTH